jgi:hypothetical protein
MYPLILDTETVKVPRSRIVEALAAEGVTGISNGYQNIHLLPMYQQRVAYGSNGFPWSSSICRREVNYEKGICPVAEGLQDSSYLGFAMCLHELSDDDAVLMAKAFYKVWDNLPVLAEHARAA